MNNDLKLIVHLGPNKTGTTALQNALAKNRGLLGAHRVIYPRLPYNRQTHHLLTPNFQDYDQLFADMRARFGNNRQNMATAGKEAWLRVRKQVERGKPRAVVLSSEFFLNESNVEHYRNFRRMLGEITSNIVLSAYIREPASSFLSARQQNAKHRAELLPPYPMIIRPRLEAIEEAFEMRVSLRPYDRDQMIGGDIVQDFTTTFLADYVDPTLIAGNQANESLSAEAISITQKYRRQFFSGFDDHIFPEDRILKNMIVAAEQKLGVSKRPKLHPEIAEYVNYSSTDFIWIRDRYGISFPTISYDRLLEFPAKNNFEAFKNVRDFFEVDPDHEERILFDIINTAVQIQIRHGILKQSWLLQSIAKLANLVRDSWKARRPS